MTFTWCPEAQKIDVVVESPLVRRFAPTTLAVYVGHFRLDGEGSHFSACLPANPFFLPSLQNYLFFWKDVEIYGNTLTSGNYHSSLNGKCAKQLPAIICDSLQLRQNSPRISAKNMRFESGFRLKARGLIYFFYNVQLSVVIGPLLFCPVV